MGIPSCKCVFRSQRVCSDIASLSYPVFLIRASTIEGVLLFLSPDSWLMFWFVCLVIIIALLAQASDLKWIDGKIPVAFLNSANG